VRDVKLTDLFQHRVAQKYINRSGLVHAIAVSYHAFRLALKQNVDVDIAAKAGFLHDIGHYTWYKDGKWDYGLYRQNDIHAIKGAERAHKLLIRCGENPIKAKEISIAILFHTDSFLPGGNVIRTPLQSIIKLADEMDEEPGGLHHYRTIQRERAIKSIQHLDTLIDEEYSRQEEAKGDSVP
jgi:uncharacterized protein